MATPAERDAAARRAARAFARIRQWGDPVLRTPASAVEHFDEALQRQAEEMIRLMRDANGVGLAAPQVGVSLRLCVYRPDADSDPRALVNPIVEEASSDSGRDLEGCLSLRGVQVEVERARAVVVAARDPDGEAVRIEAEDYHARVLQHEIDHLDGVLMLSRADPKQRREAVRALREGRAWSPPSPPGEEGEPGA